jgi:arsenate reductase (glutaredoxin)
MLKIYHNPRCKKSCEGLKFLQDKGIGFEIVKYLETGLTKEILNEIVLKTNRKPVELIRTQEDFYKKELKGKKFSDEEWIKIIVENPKLLQRPIVVAKYKAVIAQPANKIDELNL